MYVLNVYDIHVHMYMQCKMYKCMCMYMYRICINACMHGE